MAFTDAQHPVEPECIKPFTWRAARSVRERPRQTVVSWASDRRADVPWGFLDV